ncbi:S8 family peptidase [Aquimarina sp. M1]
MKSFTYQSLLRRLSFQTLIVSSLLIVSCENDVDSIEPENLLIEEGSKGLLSKEELNAHIIETIGDSDNSFDWNAASEEVLWSAVVHSDHELMVGYKKSQWNDDDARQYMFDNGSLNKSLSEDISNLKNGIINQVLETESSLNKSISKKQIVVRENDPFLAITIKVDNIETLRALRASDNIRYVESTYTFYDRPISKDGLGCGVSQPASLRNYYDYLTISPGSKVGWNFRYHNIKETWEYGGFLGKGIGKGIGVAIFDTGVSSSQNLLLSAFNSGIVTGRSQNYVDYYEADSSPWDICGHGTALAGVIAAPRTNRGNTIGVAYGCNLQAVKANGDVFINGSKDIAAVSKSFYLKALERNVRIISMSMGGLFTNTEIKDAIIFAYRKGKLIFAAAGTIAQGGVISGTEPRLSKLTFPANMKEYGGDVVFGVTGITTRYQACKECVQGPYVDFAVVMEQSNGTQPLALTTYSNDPSTIGGSSVATATMAGIAAIVWGKNSTLPRANVVRALKQTADYPNRGSNWFGYGKADALKAYKAFR